MEEWERQKLRTEASIALRSSGADAAAILLRAALDREPGDAEIIALLGSVEYEGRHYREAAAHLQCALSLGSGDERVRLLLAGAKEALGENDAAEALYASVAEHPADERSGAYAAFHLAGMLLGRGETETAESLCAKYLAVYPKDPGFLRLKMLASLRLARHAQAVAAYDLLPASPQRQADLALLAKSFQRLGDYSGFLRRFGAVNDLSCGELCASAAEIFNACGMREAEERCQRRALELRPDDPALHSYELKTMTESDTVSGEEILAFAREWDRKFGTPRDRPAFRSFPRPPRAGRRVRLGILSHSFRRHVTMTILRPLLPELAKRFELYGYYDDDFEDAFTDEARACCAVFRNTSALSEADAADRIHADALDVLIDISGHFSAARTRLLTYKPAPLVIHYADSSSTLGLSAVDCRFSDAIAEPPEWGDPHSSEKVLRLPHGFFLYAPLLDCGEPAPCPSDRNGFVTFGSCTALHKITPTTLALWKSALDAAPQSRFLLARDEFARDPALREYWRRKLVAAGFDNARLALVSGDKDDFVRLKFYSKIDIALDAYPYSGVTTTLDALWMGVPVVNYRQRLFINRVGSSLLEKVGLSDLVAEKKEDFATLAAALAADTERRRTLRRTLRARFLSSPLSDGAGMAADMEKAILAELELLGL